MIRKFTATSMLAIAALTIAGATAHAEPAVAPPSPNSTVQTDVLPGIHYTASIVDNSVVVKTDGGSLTTLGNQFQVLDAQGNLVMGLPLTYKKDGKDWPIAAKVEGNNTATLTPSTNPADAVVGTSLQPIDATADFNAALGVAATQIGLAMGVGALLGTVVGGGLGCVVGAIGGAALTPPVFLPGAAGGCLAGIVSGAAIGVFAGTVIIGVPVAVVSAIQFYNAINTPTR